MDFYKNDLNLESNDDEEQSDLYEFNQNINKSDFIIIENKIKEDNISSLTSQKHNIISFFQQIHETYYELHDHIQLLHLLISLNIEISQEILLDLENFQKEIINSYKNYSIEFIFCSLLSIKEYNHEISYEEFNHNLLAFFHSFFDNFTFLLNESKIFIPILSIKLKFNILINILFDDTLNMILMLCKNNFGNKLFNYINPRIIINKLIDLNLYQECLMILQSIASTNQKNTQQFIITILLNLMKYVEPIYLIHILEKMNISYTIDKSQFNIFTNMFSLDNLHPNPNETKYTLSLLTKFIDKNIFTFTPDEYLTYTSFLFDIHLCRKAAALFITIIKKHHYFANILINELILSNLIQDFEDLCFKHKISILHLINTIIQNSYGDSIQYLLDPHFICHLIEISNIETEWLLNETLSSIIGLLHLSEKENVEMILSDENRQNLLDDFENYENNEIDSKLDAIRSIFME